MPRRPSTHVDNAAAVGARLREVRERRGLSQRDLAFEGCTPAYISRVEAGARVPSLQILRELGERLGVSADYLATGQEDGAIGEPLLEAELAARMGETDLARTLYEEALRPGRPAALVAAAKAGMGQLLFRDGDHVASLSYLEEALATAVLPARDATTTAECLGRAYAQLARFDEALALFERFLAQAKEGGHVPDTIRFAVLLANTLIDRGNFGRAEEVLASVLDDARQATDPVMRASLYWSQSRLHGSQGRPDLAADFARLALATLRTTEHTVFAAKAFMLLAKLENDRGHAGEALALVDEGYETIAATGNRYEQALFQLEKARALAELGEADEAGSLALGTVAAFQQSSAINAARGYAVAAGVLRQLGENARALELYELAAEALPSEDQHLFEVCSAMAEILETEGRAEEALQVLKRAVKARAGISE